MTMGFLTYGLLCPFCFPLGILGLFTNFVFSWVFTDFIGLSRPNYFILILGVLWACHQSPTFFACIALGLPRPILTFSHHTLPMSLLLAISLFLSSFEPICFLNAHLLISWICDPLFLPFGLNGFCSLSFANFFSICVAGLGFLPFIWVSQKDPQQ